MYREELAHKKVGAITGIFITVGIVLAILAVMFIMSFLSFWTGIGWIQFLALIIVALGAFFFVRYFLTDYIYLVEDGAILFGRRIGRREKALSTIPLRNIKKAGSFEDMEQGLSGRKRYKYTYKKKKDAFVIDCGDIAIIFSQTDELEKKIGKGGRTR